ncbi:MAG: DUF512 domain-containing protein [Acutalibacteraceae bacterium]
MSVLIQDVQKNSYAAAKGIKSGYKLISVNGKDVNDMLDYRFYTVDKKLCLSFLDNEDLPFETVIVKENEYDEIGLLFSDFLLDKEHSCKNNCIFCFIDQLPKNLRKTLYFKDDDVRLSFLFGNYISLTNITEQEIERIKTMHISPVNISVHTMNEKLRVKMMRNKNAGKSLKFLKDLADFGTKINAQIVVCPGINDGEELRDTLAKLGELYPSVQSVAVVPVGLTSHRENLYKLEDFTREKAGGIIDLIDEFNAHFMFYNDGYRLVFAGDEFYLKAQREIPSVEAYGDFNQLDNGVGMLALFRSDFTKALSQCKRKSRKKRKITIATGEAAFPLISELSAFACDKYRHLTINTVPIKNKLFGESVTVAGLLSGRDIIDELSGLHLGEELLIPRDCLRYEGDLFLDDISLDEMSKKLSVRVTPVENNGYALLEHMLFSD